MTTASMRRDSGAEAVCRRSRREELKARAGCRGDLFLLDVREPHEWDISNLAHLGALLIPKGDLDRVNELDTAREMVVQCRSGARSAAVIDQLLDLGFSRDRLHNLVGGINQWARTVDGTMPVY